MRWKNWLVNKLRELLVACAMNAGGGNTFNPDINWYQYNLPIAILSLSLLSCAGRNYYTSSILFAARYVNNWEYIIERNSYSSGEGRSWT